MDGLEQFPVRVKIVLDNYNRGKLIAELEEKAQVYQNMYDEFATDAGNVFKIWKQAMFCHNKFYSQDPIGVQGIKDLASTLRNNLINSRKIICDFIKNIKNTYVTEVFLSAIENDIMFSDCEYKRKEWEFDGILGVCKQCAQEHQDLIEEFDKRMKEARQKYN